MSPAGRHGTKMLIVDDERTITDTLCMIFEHCGFDCLKAYDAEKALEIGMQTPLLCF
jgi:DNA-binding response OmpR family regulator